MKNKFSNFEREMDELIRKTSMSFAASKSTKSNPLEKMLKNFLKKGNFKTLDLGLKNGQ